MAMGLLSGKRGNWQGRKDNSWLAQTGWNSALRPSANRRLHSFLRKPQLSPAFTPRPTAYVLARYLLFPLRLAQGRHRTADQGSDLRRDRPGDSAGAAVHGTRGHRADDGPVVPGRLVRPAAGHGLHRAVCGAPQQGAALSMVQGPLEQALSQIGLWQQRAQAAGIALRPAPPQPTSCCGRGCNGCVWEGFYDAVLFWCEDAGQALSGGPG